MTIDQSSSDDQPESDSDLQAEWLKLVQLKDNPFQYDSAEKEPDLPQYFVALGEPSIRNLIRESKPWLVLADAGSGKTALHTQVTSSCRTHPEFAALCIQYGAHELESTLEQVNGSIDFLEPIHHARTIVNQAISLDPRLSEGLKISTAMLTSPTAIPESIPLRETFISYAREDRTRVDNLVDQSEIKWYSGMV